MKEKRCIFHIPNYIDKTSKSGSSVRPQMMIKAFEEIGYHVDYVMGYGKERKSQIEKIKRNIRNGVKYVSGKLWSGSCHAAAGAGYLSSEGCFF